MITPKLAGPALEALRNATTTKDSVSVTPLDRRSWQQVNAAMALIAGGGHWDRGRRAWVFTRPPGGELRAFLVATQDPHPCAQPDDTALVPAGPLLELADRLEALADSAAPELSKEEQAQRAGCYSNAATALRSTVTENAHQSAGWVVARREENGQLVDDADGKIHDAREPAEKTLRMVRINGWHGHRLYALVEVSDA